MVDANNNYTRMQKNQYDGEASRWSLQDKNAVVGTFDEQNAWEGYDLLFTGLETKELRALDFGCGPGRNIVKYWDRFKQIDGVDISAICLEKARIWVQHNQHDANSIKLYHCNGVDLSGIPSDTYDMVFSTICMQHIPVYEIRFSYLTEFYRVLKKGGMISIQMGYGGKKENWPWASYYDNAYYAPGTNGLYDVCIQSSNELQADFDKIGFSNLTYTLTECSISGCSEKQWIFFRGTK